MMILTPLIAVHMTAAISATIIGPFALWARLGMINRPKLHRAFGYAWVTMMIVTAISAIFIRSGYDLNWHGFSFIHLLIPVALLSICGAFLFLAKKNIMGHKITMTVLYINTCLITGAFTLTPGRYLGDLLWK
jgi:uncharacterized membrane protein